jgi:hypothetical protein
MMLATKLQEAAANSTLPTYIEDVFSTYLYSGNSSTQTITNNIDLSTKGGLVWIKGRNSSYSNLLFTSGLTSNSYYMQSNGTNGESNGSPDFAGFNSNGFTLEAPYGLSATALNGSGYNFSSWSFAKAPKFFDVVTYTGNGVDGRIIASNHNMGSGVLGAVFIKRTNSSSTNWKSSFRGGQGGQIPWLSLNLSINDSYDAWVGGNVNPGINGFSVSAYEGNISAVNAVGGTYVAYLFAHNAGGFGLSGTDNVITCGSYVGNGSATGPVIDIGWEPQWILTKRATGGTGNWIIFDNMRGLSMTNAARLLPNGGNAESSSTFIAPTSTGFRVTSTDQDININNSTYVYMAIRRGPMKVPTSGTSVFAPVARTGTGNATTISGIGFAPDLLWDGIRNTTGYGNFLMDKLRGGSQRLGGASTAAEVTESTAPVTQFGNTSVNISASGTVNDSGVTYVNWFMQRAPSFFDEVCYTGTGSQLNVNHNLGSVPELIIVKNRNKSGGENWAVYNATLGAGFFLWLNTTDSVRSTYDAGRFPVAPTSSVFTVGSDPDNGGSFNYVAYLFATCAGVSKVGSYTGNGGSQNIDCGFTSGARFILIKRTDNAQFGDWKVFDTARGIVSGNDPYLKLNEADSEQASYDGVDPYSAGFTVNQDSANLSINNATYIFLAIA